MQLPTLCAPDDVHQPCIEGCHFMTECWQHFYIESRRHIAWISNMSFRFGAQWKATEGVLICGCFMTLIGEVLFVCILIMNTSLY